MDLAVARGPTVTARTRALGHFVKCEGLAAVHGQHALSDVARLILRMALLPFPGRFAWAHVHGLLAQQRGLVTYSNKASSRLRITRKGKKTNLENDTKSLGELVLLDEPLGVSERRLDFGVLCGIGGRHWCIEKGKSREIVRMVGLYKRLRRSWGQFFSLGS